jgi:hypothetical protein
MKGGTLVDVEFKYEISNGLLAGLMNKIMLKRNFEKGFEGMLKGLKKHIEEGEVILNNDSIKGYKVSFA